MNKVFLALSTQECTELSQLLEVHEQPNWTIEKTDAACQLCGYFDENYEPAWVELQVLYPALKEKSLVVEPVEACDWKDAYKRYLHPVRIGPIHIVPVWERDTYEIPSGDFGIFLDAEMAFGTGMHETTRLCLSRAVDYKGLFSKDLFLKQAIDVGCGSGILSIAAAKLGFAGVYGFDIDPDAIQVSRSNAVLNETPGIEFRTADLKAGILGRQGDLIMANVLASVLIEHASILVNTVNRYGCLSLSGILKEEASAVEAVFTPLVKQYWDSYFLNTRVLGQWAELAYFQT
ncbi:MAG: 50S ribosomal protein L11 methyltransferase [Verrucomicrobiota bacterium]|nr:MAG: 50S ribosomal protein L11 methyltransferase [Verrucomicrobiota bacterium]